MHTHIRTHIRFSVSFLSTHPVPRRPNYLRWRIPKMSRPIPSNVRISEKGHVSTAKPTHTDLHRNSGPSDFRVYPHPQPPYPITMILIINDLLLTSDTGGVQGIHRIEYKYTHDYREPWEKKTQSYVLFFFFPPSIKRDW